MDYKKYVIDFVEGRVKPKDFIEYCNNNSEVLDWIQSVVPKGKICYKHYDVDGKRIPEEVVPYDIRIIWGQELTWSGESESGKLQNLHHMVSQLILEIFPDEVVVKDNTLSDRFRFLLEILPDYIHGTQAEELVDKIINSVPESMPKGKRIKEIKEKIKQAFHLDGKKYPRWWQNTDWPFSKTGKPKRFVSQGQGCHEEITEYIFEDVDTGERETVIDHT